MENKRIASSLSIVVAIVLFVAAFVVGLTVLLVLLFGSTRAYGADFTGVPRIVDGDTLAIGSTKFRLQGIDAPKTDQICLNANGDHWTCGIEARDQLAVHIGGREIGCSSDGIDAYHRTLGTCYFGDEDLNAWMVQEGGALAYVKYSRYGKRYSADC
jgi:endonuclease YncB( thermonuclease family)